MSIKLFDLSTVVNKLDNPKTLGNVNLKQKFLKYFKISLFFLNKNRSNVSAIQIQSYLLEQMTGWLYIFVFKIKIICNFEFNT
jgi:hypothetical protein